MLKYLNHAFGETGRNLVAPCMNAAAIVAWLADLQHSDRHV